jgi:hypothetical protein
MHPAAEDTPPHGQGLTHDSLICVHVHGIWAALHGIRGGTWGWSSQGGGGSSAHPPYRASLFGGLRLHPSQGVADAMHMHIHSCMVGVGAGGGLERRSPPYPARQADKGRGGTSARDRVNEPLLDQATGLSPLCAHRPTRQEMSCVHNLSFLWEIHRALHGKGRLHTHRCLHTASRPPA